MGLYGGEGCCAACAVCQALWLDRLCPQVFQRLEYWGVSFVYPFVMAVLSLVWGVCITHCLVARDP